MQLIKNHRGNPNTTGWPVPGQTSPNTNPTHQTAKKATYRTFIPVTPDGTGDLISSRSGFMTRSQKVTRRNPWQVVCEIVFVIVQPGSSSFHCGSCGIFTGRASSSKAARATKTAPINRVFPQMSSAKLPISTEPFGIIRGWQNPPSEICRAIRESTHPHMSQ